MEYKEKDKIYCRSHESGCYPFFLINFLAEISAFRYAQKWGEQFNGDDFDLYKYWNESMDSDINSFKYSGIDEIIEVALEGGADVLDQEPIH